MSESPFDDAKNFWEWYNREVRDNYDAEHPFIGSTEGETDQPQEWDEYSSFDGLQEMIDPDSEHIDPMTGREAELATTAYTIEEMESAVNYVKDAPPGILKIWITEEGEIEIYRYTSP